MKEAGTIVGMFDHVRCRYPLPNSEAQDLEYQSKSTPAQALDHYVISPYGRLLHEDYDKRMEENGEAPVGFYLHRENCRWVAVDFRGELEIHTSVKQSDGTLKWYSYLLWFKDNRVPDMPRGNVWARSSHEASRLDSMSDEIGLISDTNPLRLVETDLDAGQVV